MTPKATIPLLACLLLLPLQAFAQGAGGQTYVIRQGDTLWSISERFVKDPDYWPSLWSNNPELSNPHLIRPGQTITIYDSGLEIVPAPEVAAPPAEPVVEIVPPAPPVVEEERPLVTFQTRRGTEGFIARDELADAGSIVDTVDNRIMMGTGDTVFLEMKDAATVAVGDHFSAFQIGAPVTHPTDGRVVGHKISQLGTIEVAAISGEVATGRVTESFREMTRGTRLRPFHPELKEISLKKSSRAMTGHLVAAEDEKLALGTHDVIYLDLGSSDGLEAGNVLTISRGRQVTELARKRQDLQLPDVLLGAAVVLQTYPHSASALVIKTVGPLYRGDRVDTMVD